jgi:hypothetical protein
MFASAQTQIVIIVHGAKERIQAWKVPKMNSIAFRENVRVVGKKEVMRNFAYDAFTYLCCVSDMYFYFNK